MRIGSIHDSDVNLDHPQSFIHVIRLQKATNVEYFGEIGAQRFESSYTHRITGGGRRRQTAEC